MKFLSGLKPQLVARLSKALKTEESESIVAAENQSESNADGGTGETLTTSVDGVTAGGGSNNSNDMHESASNDSIDIDMADIVVIDEYDSTKNDTKNESSSKRVCTIEKFLHKENIKTQFRIIYRVHQKHWTNVNSVGLRNVIVCLKIHKSYAIHCNIVARWINSHAKCDLYQFYWIIDQKIRKSIASKYHYSLNFLTKC